MSYPLAQRAPLSAVTVDELTADPARAKVLAFEALPQLLTEIASRTATLKTLEGALLALILGEHLADSDPKNGGGLLSAPQVAELFDVPESWVRERARLGTLPSIRLGHYVRFKSEEIQRFLSERAKQAA